MLKTKDIYFRYHRAKILPEVWRQFVQIHWLHTCRAHWYACSILYTSFGAVILFKKHDTFLYWINYLNSELFIVVYPIKSYLPKKLISYSIKRLTATLFTDNFTRQQNRSKIVNLQFSVYSSGQFPIQQSYLQV